MVRGDTVSHRREGKEKPVKRVTTYAWDRERREFVPVRRKKIGRNGNKPWRPGRYGMKR